MLSQNASTYFDFISEVRGHFCTSFRQKIEVDHLLKGGVPGVIYLHGYQIRSFYRRLMGYRRATGYSHKLRYTLQPNRRGIIKALSDHFKIVTIGEDGEY
jgi:hypothetical protein